MKVALVQMTSVLDYKQNLDKIDLILSKVDSASYDAIFLPECFYSMSDGKAPTPYLVEMNNEHFENIRNIAIKYKSYLVGGSVAYLEDGKVLNRALIFDPDGKLINFYDKVNLFSCDITKNGERKVVNEGIIYTRGHKPQIVEILGFKIGLAICFDLRFPNHLLNYYQEKCDLITFASAFTVPTGMAHWEVLLRARAIEGQCFVVASGQVGSNSEVVKTYGHSMIISPWGEILEEIKDDEGVRILELDKSLIKETRDRVHVNLNS